MEANVGCDAVEQRGKQAEDKHDNADAEPTNGFSFREFFINDEF